MTLECIKFTPFNKGTLRGFADVHVPKHKMTYYSLTLHEKDGKKWINIPSRPIEKEDGTKEWLPYYRFDEPEHLKLFCSHVKEAIEKKLQETQGENNYESDGEICF